MSVAVVPVNNLTLARFGKGNRARFERYTLTITAFLEGKSEHTKRAYTFAINQFFDLFDWTSPEDIKYAHGVAYKKWLLEHREVSESTTYARMSAVISLFNHLCVPDGTDGEALLQHNPLKLVPRGDIQPTPYAQAKAMEWSVFKQIVDGINPNPIGMRDKAILIFFAFTGRRRAEVANLRVKDLDLTSRPRSYRTRVKGGKVLHFELPSICYDAIRAYWIASDRLQSLRADSAVFSASTHQSINDRLDPEGPLTTRSINNILSRAARRAGVDLSTVRIHALRHMTARDLDAAGARLQDIQAILGHATPNTTQIYLGQLAGPVPSHEDALIRVREEASKMAHDLVD